MGLRNENPVAPSSAQGVAYAAALAEFNQFSANASAEMEAGCGVARLEELRDQLVAKRRELAAIVEAQPTP